MKAVMISIQPCWCEQIVAGVKTMEVRKNRPKQDPPFKCYIYQTKMRWVFKLLRTLGFDRFADILGRGFGKVIGEFVCDYIRPFGVPYPAFQGMMDKDILDQTCCTYYQLHRYAYHDTLYGWHISNLKVYEKPKKLEEFYKFGASTPEELDERLCEYCVRTDYGEHKASATPNGYWSCEGAWCDEAYSEYLDTEYVLTRPPQSWCYVED